MRRKIVVLISLCFVLGLNIYFRSFPIYFPQIKVQAKNIVEEQIRQRIAQEVYQKFPQYDILAKERLIKVNFAEYRRYYKKDLKKQTQELYEKLKDRFQDQSGQTYLMELDCWHWSRYVENVVNFGRPGDDVVSGKQFDTLMLSPLGDYLAWNHFNFYFPAFLYKVFSLIKRVPLFTFLFYIPLFYIFLFIIVVYYFVYRSSGVLAAVMSSLYIGLYPVFIPRSCAGWFDMDILNLLFPLLVMWAYFRASVASSFRLRTFWLFLSSFWLGLFTFTWTNWWFIFFMLIIFEIVFLSGIVSINLRTKSRDFKPLKQHSLMLVLFLSFSFLWILLFCGFSPFVVLYREATAALVLRKPLLPSIWPNVFATVGELKRASLNEIMNAAGGGFIFIPAIFSLLVLFIRNVFSRNIFRFRRNTIVMLMLWFLLMLYACFQGVRFAVFLAVPLGVALGLGVNDLYAYMKPRIKKWKAVLTVTLVVIYINIFLFPRADAVARGIFPLMNDTWYKALVLMREKTPKDTTLNSWWDFGDWFKVVAKRKVIFDGQSQNRPQAYWMAKALLSANEQESVGILRMLNNGANKAFELIDEYLHDPLQAMLLLEGVIPLEAEKAKEILLDFLPLSVAEEVMRLLFSEAGNVCFVVEYSMMPKITAISYLGNWNFSKVYIAQQFNKKEQNQIIDHLVRLGRDRAQMRNFYQEVFLIPPKNLENWISRPVQFYSGVVKGKEKEGVVFFENGFIYNINEKSVYTNEGRVPHSLFTQEGEQLREIVYTNSNLPFSILVFKTENMYSSVLLDRELGRSLLVRLYFLRAKGLKHFSAFIDVEEGNDYIGVYRVNW